MSSTISMQDMMYINLFSKITGVITKYCFPYNNMILYAVPSDLISKAVGKEGINVKRLSNTLRKRIKVIALAQEGQEKKFIESIVEPITFKDVQVKENEIILTAGNQMSKASLMGRNKQRMQEMQRIIESCFGKSFTIV